MALAFVGWVRNGSTWRETAPASVLAESGERIPALQAPSGGAFGPGGLGEWEFLGPADIGGPTSHVAFLPGDPQVAYTITHGGDVYRTGDGGASWTFLNHLPLRRGRLEPVAGRPGEIYAYARQMQPSGGEYQVAVFYSADGGRTWVERRPATQAAWLTSVSGLRTVPSRPDEVWAATSYGLLRSTDAGRTWSLVYSQGSSTECDGLEISLATSRAYTVCRLSAWNVIGASLSGAGWSQLTQNGTRSNYARIAIAPSQPGVIYFATFGEGPDTWYAPRYLGTILRSSDGGTTWETRFERARADAVGRAVPGDFEFECSAPGHGAMAGDHARIAVDPANADSLWVTGFEIFRSDDGGASFGRAQARKDEIFEDGLGLTIGLNSEQSTTALAFAPGYDGGAGQTVLVSDISGVRVSQNARATVQTAATLSCDNSSAVPAVAWVERNRGMAGARIVHGQVGPTGEIVASSPDFGLALSDGGGPDSWARITRARNHVAGQVSLDPVDSPNRFVGSWNAGIVDWRWDNVARKWVGKQSNYDSSGLYPSGYDPGGGDEFYREVYYSRFIRDPSDADRLVSGSEDGVYESRDRGSLWQLISPNVDVSAYGLKRDGSIIAATRNGLLLSQVHAGTQQWQLRDVDGCDRDSGTCISPGVVFTGFVSAPDPASDGLYATARIYGGPKIWYSSDGRVWTPVDGDSGQPGALPRVPGDTSLAIDPDDPTHLYAGTPTGVYVTEDSGRTWIAAVTPFPGTPVAKLQFVKSPGGRRRLIAFTYGHGIWAADVAPSTTFVDVPTYHWAHDYVVQLFRAGVTSGCNAEPLMYCPDRQVTRDQMAVFLLLAKHGAGYRPPAAAGVFADVAAGHWAASWIEQLYAEGVTSGCATGPLLFCPDRQVTRDQMAVFVLLARHGAGYRPPAATGLFADVPLDHWAAPWIEQLARDGVTGGCSATPKMYCPSTVVTRDQMAVFLVRAFGL